MTFAACKSLGWIRPLISALTLLSASLCAPVATAQPSDSSVDQGLVQALHQATRNVHDRSTDLDSLLWLSAMSERLDDRIENPFYRIRLLKNVYDEAEREGLDPQLVLAVIDIESNFDRFALSSAGAQGLMQVMPFWKDVYGRPDDDLFNPLISLRYGCRILRHYLDKYESPTDALAAYNGSLGRATYPNKIYRRLNSRWQYQGDSFETKPTRVALR